MTNYTTSTPVTSTVEDIYGLLGVGTSNTGKLLNPTALISSAIGSLTVADTSQIDLSYTGGQLSGTIVNGSIGTTQLSSGVNTSLGLANTAVQPAALSPYLTTATAASTYLPLSGGALTGAVTSTSTITTRQSANTVQFLVSSGTAQTINWNSGGNINLDLSSATGNVTLTLQNPVSGATYRMRVQQGATVRNLTFPDGTVQQGGGGNVYTGIAGVDFLTVYYNGSDYLVQSALNSGFVQPTNNAIFTGVTQAAALRLNGTAVIASTTAPATRTDGTALVAGDLWYKPTDNGIPGTAGGWIWTGSDWVSINVFPLSIPFVNGSSNNQTIRSESVGTNLGIIVSGLATQIAVLNANPTSANYWTAAISVSGTPIATLSTQNAVSYPHNYSTPNTVIPARASIPVGETLTATALGQTSRSWYGMATLGSDVYACVFGGDIYKQTGGTGNFVALGQTSRSWTGMAATGSDVYACVYNGDIYKQTGGVGNFVALGQTSRNWHGMTTLGTDVYACVSGGDIYKQTNGTGNFIALSQTSRDWRAMATLGTDVYACVSGGDIYKQTNGTGDFLPLSQTLRGWTGMTTLGTDVYACVNSGDIYKQTNGTGDFIALGQTSRGWWGMTTLGTNVYVCVLNGDIYRLTAGSVTSVGHSLEVTLTRTGAVSLPYVSITANCQVIHP